MFISGMMHSGWRIRRMDLTIDFPTFKIELASPPDNVDANLARQLLSHSLQPLHLAMIQSLVLYLVDIMRMNIPIPHVPEGSYWGLTFDGRGCEQ